MASFQFNTADVPARENNFDLLPAGKYAMQVVESEIAPLKSGNGTALKLTMEVLADGYRGRKLWVNLNVQHTNAQAEQISQQQLRELCDAIGLTRMNDTSELHNKPFEGKVKIRVSKDANYEDQNEVIGYKSLANGAPAPGFNAPRTVATPSAPVAANAPAAVAATGAATPPWARKA